MSYGCDLHMMVKTSGQERTGSEWKWLLSQAGFRLNCICKSRGIQGLIEAQLASETQTQAKNGMDLAVKDN